MGNPSKRHPRYLFRDQMTIFLEPFGLAEKTPSVGRSAPDDRASEADEDPEDLEAAAPPADAKVAP